MIKLTGLGKGKTPDTAFTPPIATPSVTALDAPIDTALTSKTYHAFGFDRMVEGYSGDSVRLKELDGDTESDFGFDSNGFFDLDAVDTWRSGADVDVVKFYDQTGNGADCIADSTVSLIRSDIVQRFGVDYEEDDGAELDIQAITQANPASVQCNAHGLSTGDVVYVGTVAGMVEINGGYHAITVTDANNFTLDDVDSTGYTAYSSGGYAKHMKRELLTRSTSQGGIGCDLGGVGALKISGCTVDVSGSGFEAYMLTSPNTRKVTQPTSDPWGGNNDQEWIMTYGNYTNMWFRYRFYSTFGTYGRVAAGGEDNSDIGGAVPTKKQFGQIVYGMQLTSALGSTTINGVTDLYEVVSTNNAANLAGGVGDDRGMLIGAFYTSGDEPATTTRGNFIFGGVVMCETLTATERTMVQAKMGAIGQQHRLKTKEEIEAVWDEIVYMKDVGAIGAGDKRTVTGINNKLSLEYNGGTNAVGTTTTNFNYVDEISGLEGINHPDQNQANGFRATDNYFAGTMTGTVFALHRADIPSNQLAYVFTQGTEDGFSTNMTNRSLAIGKDHSTATFWSTVATSRGGLATGSRYFTNGTGIGDTLSDQAMVKYNRNTVHRSVLLNSTGFGYNNWTFDSLANRDPNAPYEFDAPVSIPLAQNTFPSLPYNDVLLLQVGTFEAPAEYNPADDEATRKPYALQAENRSYIGTVGGAIGQSLGDIAINVNAAVVDSDPNARIISSHWFDNHEGTTHAIGFLPDVVLTKQQIEELQVNYYKMFE